MKKEFLIAKGHIGERLDIFLAHQIRSLSRSVIKKYIDTGYIRVNTTAKKGSYLLKYKDKITVDFPRQKEYMLKPYHCTVPILYEDNAIIVINKPPDITVHPPHKNYHHTLVNALLTMGKTLYPASPLRPGLVHRLDKETSGLLVLAKTGAAYYNLIEQFKSRSIEKEYRALVWGVLKQDTLQVSLPLGRDNTHRLKVKVQFVKSKSALTKVKVLQRFKDATYLSLHLVTGRMHQIRVHLRFLGFPLVGDKKYGRKDSYENLFLHAHTLGFVHPLTGKKMRFQTPLPEHFGHFIKEREHV